MAAVVDHAIDAAAATEGAALGGGDLAAGGAFAGLGLELPGDGGVEQGFDEAGGNVDVGVQVARPGLEHADGDAFVLGEAVGEHGAGGAGADDDVVELVHS